ncbi:hypothetical protein IWW51_000743 [Coemansia sp. RSA 2702]|nr:hypothetical protein IWW51_000743 [Coemansia sp. RSA 2702]
MTNVFEGPLIQAFRRLEKLLRQMCQAAKAIGNIDLENKFANSIVKIKCDAIFAASLLGSFMATLTTLFAKSLVNLLSVSLFDHDNQFTNALSWAILLVTVFTAASQVYWINQGLLRYDALLQVPVFYVIWTVFDIIGGGIYFNEFREFTTVKYVLFVLGVAVVFSGVGLLANRLKNH